MNSAMRLPGRIVPHALLITTTAVPLTGWAVHALTLHRRLADARRDLLRRRYCGPGLLRLHRLGLAAAVSVGVAVRVRPVVDRCLR